MRKNAGLLLISILLLTACNLPTRPIEVTPTVDAVATQVSVLKTAMPTATATLEPTLVPSDTVLPPSETPTLEPPTVTPTPTLADLPDWRESFDSGKAFYLFSSTETEVKMENGALVLTGFNPIGWHGWSLTYNQKPQDFRLEAIFQVGACAGADMYGLVFRAADADSGYFFGATCDGRVNLHARDFADGTDREVIAMTGTNLLLAGANQTNRLGVEVSGSTIKLLVNGTLAAETQDETYKDAGYFGAFIAANQTTNFTVRMDEISLWK